MDLSQVLIFIVGFTFWATLVLGPPIFVIWKIYDHHRLLREIRYSRAGYYKLPPSERSIIVKSILFLLRNGAPDSRFVADRLDLDVYLTDQGIRRLIANNWLQGNLPLNETLNQGSSVTARQKFFPRQKGLVTDLKLTAQGRQFLDDYYGQSGDIFNVGPWGTVINKSTLSEVNIASADQAFDLIEPTTGA